MYEYAAGAPQMYVDPTGLNPLAPWIIFAGTVLGAGFGAYNGYQDGGGAFGAVVGGFKGAFSGMVVSAFGIGPGWVPIFRSIAAGASLSGFWAGADGENIPKAVIRGAVETAIGVGVGRCIAGPLERELGKRISLWRSPVLNQPLPSAQSRGAGFAPPYDQIRALFREAAPVLGPSSRAGANQAGDRYGWW